MANHPRVGMQVSDGRWITNLWSFRFCVGKPWVSFGRPCRDQCWHGLRLLVESILTKTWDKVWRSGGV